MVRFLFILCLLSCLSCPCAAASNPLTLLNDLKTYSLAGHLDILEDKAGKLTITEVSSPLFAGIFKPDMRPVPNFGMRTSVYWVRFSIENAMAFEKRWLLELDYPHMDYLDLYLPVEGGRYELMQAGDRRAMSVRKFQHRNPVFPVSVDGSARTFYLRVDARGRTVIPLTLWSPDAFSQMDSRRSMIAGCYFGAILVMVVYNLFLFLTLRDRNYLYYVLDIVCFALYMFYSKGFLIEFVSGVTPVINTYSYMLFVPSLLAGLVFVRSFLDTRQNAPFIDRIIKMLLLTGILSVPAVLVLPPELWKRIMTVVMASSSLVSLSVGVICLQRGFRPARYFIAARGFRIFGVITVTLGMYNLLPVNQLTPFSLQIGSILEVVLLSFALADRINVMRREKEQAQAETVRSSHLAALGELAAGVAHEINTPVNTIINSADLLLEGSDRSTMAHDVAVIKDQGRRIATIAKSLLFFARRPAQEKVPFAVAELLQGTLDMIGAKLRKENITVSIQIPAGLADVLVHPQQIEQIFLNILTNAMHALDERHDTAYDRKILEISASVIIPAGRPFVRVSFLDNGSGINADLLGTVKDAFVTTKSAGNGLGLSISRQIAEEHGGSIDIESRVGEYTRVSLDLPGVTG